jgi:uncharacterized protein with PhoU and TrkA domain
MLRRGSGCGTVTVTPYLRAALGEVSIIGIDLSSEMVALARNRQRVRVPTPSERVREGDVLLVTGPKEAVEDLLHA